MESITNKIEEEKKEAIKQPTKLLSLATLYHKASQLEKNQFASLNLLEKASEACGLYFNRVKSVNFIDWFHCLISVRDDQLRLLQSLEHYNQMKKYVEIGVDNCKGLLKQKDHPHSDIIQSEMTKLNLLLEKVEQILVERRYGDLKENTNVIIKYKSLEEGKVVLAAKDFSKGDIVFEEIPISSHINVADLADPQKKCCSHCLKVVLDNEQVNRLLGVDIEPFTIHQPVSQLRPCKHCSKELYCSEFCRETAWREYHELLCPRDYQSETEPHPYVLLQKLSVLQQRTNPMLIARMLALVVQQIRIYMKEQSSPSTLLVIEDSFDIFQRFVFNEEPHERDTLAIQLIKEALLMHVNDLSEQSKQIISEQLLNIMIYRSLNGLILRNASTLYPITDTHQAIQEAVDKKTGGVRELLEDLMENEELGTPATDTATSALLETVLTGSGKLRSLCVTGTGVLTIHNCINHSCDPNIVTVCGYPDYRVQVVATRDIKKGEEICISYIDETGDVKSRRRALYSKYLFICHCAKCELETSLQRRR